MNKNEKMEKLREKLNSMLENGEDFSNILKLSQDLDIYILEVMNEQNDNNDKK